MMRQIPFQYITVCNGEVFIFMGTDIYTTRYNPRIPTPVAVGGPALLFCGGVFRWDRFTMVLGFS